MNEKKYLDFIDIDGKQKKAEVILAFEAGTPSKNYVIYTFNEEVNDMVAMYAAIMTKDKIGIALENIQNPDEWKMVKDVMREIAKGVEV